MTLKRRKIMTIGFGVLTLGVIGHTLFFKYQRHQALVAFFASDLAWAKPYADKTVNFCAVKEWRPSIESHQDRTLVDMSPSRRYVVRDLHKLSSDHFGLAIVEDASGKTAIIMPQTTGNSEVRWSADERYAVILQGVDMDNDLGVAKIYVGNLANGQIIYLADSTRSNCTEGGW